MEEEIKQLEKEKVEKMKTLKDGNAQRNLEDMYKKKAKELEDKLKEYKSKDREQQLMQREQAKQKDKIKGLEGEITKMKVSKVNMVRKMKDDSEKHRKWQTDRARELIQAKRQNVKKDREISQLKRDFKSKEMLAKRKQDELTALQKKTKVEKERARERENQKLKKQNVDVGAIQNWIVTNTGKMMKYRELKENLGTEQKTCDEVEG